MGKTWFAVLRSDKGYHSLVMNYRAWATSFAVTESVIHRQDIPFYPSKIIHDEFLSDLNSLFVETILRSSTSPWIHSKYHWDSLLSKCPFSHWLCHCSAHETVGKRANRNPISSATVASNDMPGSSAHLQPCDLHGDAISILPPVNQ